MVQSGLSGTVVIAVIAAAITASMPAASMAPTFTVLPAEQGVPDVKFGNGGCGDGLHLVVVTVNGTTVCVTAEEGKMMESEGEGFFYDVPTLAKATVIRDTMPILEEIHYWSWYDLKFPPFTQLFDIDEAKVQGVIFALPPKEVPWGHRALPAWLDPDIPVLTNIDWRLDSGDEKFWPQYFMEFPYISYTNRSFEISYYYTYVIPGEGGDYGNPTYQCPREQCEGQYLEIQTTSHARLLNEEAELILQATDSINSPDRHYNVYRMDLPFDNTKPMQLVLEFFVTYPFDQMLDTHHKIGMIYIRVHDTEDIMYYMVYGDIGYVVYDPTLGSGMIDQAWFAVPDESLTTFQEDYHTELDKNKTGIWTQRALDQLYERVPIPLEIVPKPPFEPDGPIDGVTPEYYLYLAGKLVEHYPLGNYQKILQDYNVKQEWIDGFLNAVPYLKPTLLEVVLGGLGVGLTARV